MKFLLYSAFFVASAKAIAIPLIKRQCSLERGCPEFNCGQDTQCILDHESPEVKRERAKKGGGSRGGGGGGGGLRGKPPKYVPLD
jgi:hypothetical protein